jgi:nicotinamide-nucleotide amidase
MRTLVTAELLSIGSELTVGETRDTNAGELARSLSELGVEVLRMTALRDELATVRDAFSSALERADLVVSTGGLGPTPDDLTREAIAATIGETPAVDPELERWLRGLFERRGVPFSSTNLKQAWLTSSTTAIPNANGTAPGWWVDRPDGRVVVALPGPPREMRPMWAEWTLPRLRDHGLGRLTATVTLRTTGIGESLLAERLGGLLDRTRNPTVATYARADAVDVRISAVPTGQADAAALVAATEAEVLGLIGEHVWARGDVSWPRAIAAALAARRWRLAIEETGTRGAVTALLGEELGERLAGATALAASDSGSGRSGAALIARADAARAAAGAEVGLAVRAVGRGPDLTVSIAVVDPLGQHLERRVAFLGGAMGRSRAALIAAAILRTRLAGEPGPAPRRRSWRP